jgi:hypothetical protein
MEDFSRLQDCFGQPYPAGLGCEFADFDRDGDVDDDDFTVFEARLTGALSCE